MKNTHYLLFLTICFACGTKEKPAEQQIAAPVENPASEGFNLEASDESAIEIADQVMEAMGGHKAWDDTRYITWQFFNSRQLWWDKWTGDVRVESLKSDLKILVNINDLTGKVYKDSTVLSNTDSVDFYLNRGKSMWINDSYWLVMPFKLKDSGVTLKYVREDTTEVGALSDVLQLSFKNVGETPENLYEVWVDKQAHLVTQWAFYRSDTVTTPNFITPWEDYNTYGSILLSGGRGRGKLTEINVSDSIDANVFTAF